MTAITERPKRTVFISSRVRLLIGFTLLFTIVFAGAFYWFYVYSTNVAMNRLKQEVLDMVMGAAQGVNVDEFVGLAKEGEVRADGYTDDPRYWSHVDWLVRVSRTNPNAQVYSYITGTELKEVIFIGSVGAVNTSPGGDPPPWGAKFKEHYTSSGKGSANLLTGLDHLGAKTTIYEDKWGSWMSGYGPIVNARPLFTADDLLLLEVRLGDVVLTEALGAYSSRAGVYLPLGELARLLDFAIMVDPPERSATGWSVILSISARASGTCGPMMPARTPL